MRRKKPEAKQNEMSISTMIDATTDEILAEAKSELIEQLGRVRSQPEHEQEWLRHALPNVLSAQTVRLAGRNIGIHTVFEAIGTAYAKAARDKVREFTADRVRRNLCGR